MSKKTIIPTSKIVIPQPKFEQHQSVMLDWNGERRVSITQRWYNPDLGDWWYEIFGEDGKQYPENAFGYILNGKIWYGTLEDYQHYLESESTFLAGLKTA